MTAYYNENDPYAAQWLRNLIATEHIAPGYVDERSIVDVRANDLRGYTQCHFFAGIGGWSLALRLAGWPDDRPVWTGSCPCQPFSVAGNRKGFADERHLWPVWSALIRQCRPPVIFGEQVAQAIGGGWIDAVFTDLESEGYAFGTTVLPACGVGAPHIRQRCWFVADACDERCAGQHALLQRWRSQQDRVETSWCSATGVAQGDADWPGSQGRRIEQRQSRIAEASKRWPSETRRSSAWSDYDWFPCTDGKARPVEPIAQQMVNGLSAGMGLLRANSRLEKEISDAASRTGYRDEVLSAVWQAYGASEIWDATGRCFGFSKAALLLAALCKQSRELGAVFYSATSCGPQTNNAVLRRMPATASKIACPPSRWQLSEQCASRLANALPPLPQAEALETFNGFPLACKIPGRVGRLRAYGNAIVPQVAVQFILAFTQENPMTIQLPDYLRGDAELFATDSLSANLGSARPAHISIKGNRFTLVDAAGNEEPVTTMDARTGMPYVDLVVVDWLDKSSRIFYKNAYDPNNASPPDCWSDNGIGPSIQCGSPQGKTCQPDQTGTFGCPMAVWGSATSKVDGKAIPACSKYQKLGVLLPGDEVAFLLAVPPNSLTNLRDYNKKFSGQQVTISSVVTRVSFEKEQLGTLTFNAVSYIDKDTAEFRNRIRKEKGCDILLGRGDKPIGGLPAPATVALPGPASAPQSTLQPTLQVTQVHPAGLPGGSQGAEQTAEPPKRPGRPRKSSASTAPAPDPNAPAPFLPSDPAIAGQAGFGIAQPSPLPEGLDRSLDAIFGPGA